jgi:lipopolysaccharide transport system permease protein
MMQIPRDQTRAPIAIIRADHDWWRVRIRPVWDSRHLLWLFVRRDVTLKHVQTILGPVWALTQTAAMAAVFVLLFGKILQAPTDNHPPVLFYLTGISAWYYISQTFNTVSSSFHDNLTLFSKVFFPRIVVPFAIAISNLSTLALQALLIAGVSIWYAGSISPTGITRLLAIPVLVAAALIFSLGAGALLASITIRYRDLAHARPFLIQVWMFLTPVFYPLSAVSVDYRALMLALNPAAGIVEGARFVVLGSTSATAIGLLISVVSGTTIAWFGLALFQRAERTVIDIA